MHPIRPPQPREVTRQGNPGGGGSRQQVQTELLVVNIPRGPIAPYSTFAFDLYISSSRLACLAAVTFVPDGTEDTDEFPTTIGSGAWTLEIDAWVQLSREQGGSWTRANQAMPPTPIPTSWEVASTLVRRWRGTVTLPDPSGVVAGKLYVTAIWEPSPGESNMPDEELQKLFSTCQVIVLNGGVAQVESE